MEAVAITAAVAAAIFVAVPALGGISGSHSPQGAGRAQRVIAYVANRGSGTVTPIRTATNTALPPIKAGDGPAAIVITPDGKTAYVADYVYASGTVTPIRTATNTACHRSRPAAALPPS
jgi:YVTN family beta-propeller protein